MAGYELRELSVTDGQDIYMMLQEFKPDENGFMTWVAGRSYENYQQWLERSASEAKGENLQSGYVPQTIFWLYYDGRPVAYAKLRHYLNNSLLRRGGHIGYGVRPEERGKGHGSVLIGLMRDKAYEYGIDKMLVTIDRNNFPSARATEKNGGMFDREEDGVLYYWIPCSKN